MNPLRILMTVDAVGGVWRYAMELGQALRPLGVETVFVGLGPAPSRMQTTEAHAVGELVWTKQPLDWMVDEPSQLAAVPGELQRLAARHSIDLLHLNLPSQAVGLDGFPPAVVVTHSCMPTWWKAMRKEPLPPEWRWRHRLNQAGFDCAAMTVAPSRAHAELTMETYRPSVDVSVVHNGMPLPPAAGPKQPFVLAAGRWWDEGKNARLLDDAARGLAWPVRMAGGLRGPDGQVTEIAHAHELDSVDHAALLEMMRSAGIVASPSLYEPFGLAALEGARSGAALALADIPTYRELWQDAALFFDPYDAESARAVLARLIADEDLRAGLAGKAQTRSNNYTSDRQARQMLGIYQAALGASAPLAMTGT